MGMKWPLEPEAEVWAKVQAENHPTGIEVATVSMAVSLKRIADALEGRLASGEPGKPGFDGGQLGLADAIGNAVYSAITSAGGGR